MDGPSIQVKYTIDFDGADQAVGTMHTREWADGEEAGEWELVTVMAADVCNADPITTTDDFCNPAPPVAEDDGNGATAINGGLVALALAVLHLAF